MFCDEAGRLGLRGKIGQSDFLELEFRGQQVIIEMPDLEYQTRVLTEVSLNSRQGEIAGRG